MSLLAPYRDGKAAPGPESRAENWILAALRCAAGAVENGIVLGQSIGWGAAPMRSQPDLGKILPTHGLHAHDVPEVCLALHGQATMMVGDRGYVFAPSRIALMAPGIVHAEAYSQAQEPYALLWLHYCSDRSLIGLVSQYLPEQGWRVSGHYPLCSRAVRLLWAKMSVQWLAHAAVFEAVRAELLHVLTELNHRRVQEAMGKPSKGAGKTSEELLERVRDFLEHNFTTPIDVNTVAALTRFTPNYLNSLFSDWTGQGIHEYLIALRMGKAMELFGSGEFLVKEVARRVGYGDPLYFSRAFHRYHGCWPTDAGARSLAR